MESVQRNAVPVLESLEELGKLLCQEKEKEWFYVCVNIIKRGKGRASGQVESVRQQQGDSGHIHSRNNHLFTCLGEAINQI